MEFPVKCETKRERIIKEDHQVVLKLSDLLEMMGVPEHQQVKIMARTPGSRVSYANSAELMSSTSIEVSWTTETKERID